MNTLTPTPSKSAPVRVRIGGKQVELRDDELLGEGGEGRVFRFGSNALKVFYFPSEARTKKLEAFPLGLPREVASPLELAYASAPSKGSKHEVAGYVMRLVRGGFDLGHLGERKFRERTGVSANEVVQLFVRISRLLDELHGKGVVVGDLAGPNVLVERSPGGVLTETLLDADSMQYAHFPCPVAHERYVPPSLYGVDFAKAPAFSPATDHYALAVLACESLLFTHPYGGVHPGHATLTRRAEARASIFGPGVRLPHKALPIDALDDAWLEWLTQIFERGHVSALPSALGSTRFSRCSSCALEHARRVCPSCVRRAPVPARITSGRLVLTTLHEGSGPLKAVRMLGQKLLYAFERDGRVVREDGSSFPLPAGHTRFELTPSKTYAVDADGVTCHGRDGSRESLAGTDGAFEGAFATTVSEILRVRDGILERQVAGTRVGAVYAGRTRVFAGEHLGFAFYRAFGLGVGALFSVDEGPLRQVTFPDLRGRLVDTFAHFDEAHVLFGMHLDDGRGIECRLHLFDRKGTCLAYSQGPLEGSALHAEARAGTLARGLFAVPSAEGVRLYADEAGAFREHRRFPDTAPYLEGATELHVDREGAIHVASYDRILRISLG